MSSQQLLTVQRAAACLVYLADAGPSTVSDVAHHSGMATSTAYRYLAALRDAGMVWGLPESRYGLGPRSVQFEASFRSGLAEASPFAPVLRELGAATDETVAFLVPVDDRAICIDTVESPEPLRYTFSRGVSKSMLRGASAKAMLAWMDAASVNALLDGDTTFGPPERERLLAELPDIHAHGYVVTCGEVDFGVWAVGVPVFNDAKGLEGSLSTIAPSSRAEGREAFLIRATVEAAGKMTPILGQGLNYGA